MNPDSYNFTAFCPICKEDRGVSASKRQIKEGGQIEVYAVRCDHNWKLTQDDSDQLRKSSSAIGAV